MPATTSEPYPGQSLGLPETGRGALASWRARMAALVVDWGASMVVAITLFGAGVLTASDWRRWMIMAVYFAQKSLLTALTGSSFGQLLTRVGVTMVSGEPLGWWRAPVRAALLCLVLPALVVGPERRGLHDLALGTVVVNRR